MLAPHLDYTLLRADATHVEVQAFCAAAVAQGYYAVCLPPYYVAYAAAWLQGAPVKIVSVAGFPQGQNLTTTKLQEVEAVAKAGAHEVDCVLNIAAFKSGELEYVAVELRRLRAMTAGLGVVMKVIVESGLMAHDELVVLAGMCAEAEVDFVKTSTGFVSPGAELEKVRLLREILPPEVRLKASGGVRTAEQARAFLEAGADRIGTSSLLTDES